MLSIVAISSADTSLGKIDKASLSQQTLMELFIEGITTKKIICGNPNNPIDITGWPGVAVNSNGEVITMNWGNPSFEGTIALEWLPLTINRVKVCQTRLSGTLNLENLPDGLEHLELRANAFVGTVVLTQLPPSLVYLSLADNQLSGTLDLTKLPDSLQSLYLYDNSFEGETDLSQLSERIRNLNVDNNVNLSGKICEGPFNIFQQRRFFVYNTKVEKVQVG